MNAGVKKPHSDAGFFVFSMACLLYSGLNIELVEWWR